ncbi:hypothetical protein DAMNIGENAA_06110 [Desulforhabdus amnigena]|jgi:uncharacterized protein YcbK (DUF882 family)|uniref:Murein endopeptidase K n=2 Tax=Desulforhabdus amnigena TaxID=40218 RepID=A0A9W6D0R3_9BACT|nr:hypothetical protein DAMNIGENAA_06110 [Desulforhabdus amnigena]
MGLTVMGIDGMLPEILSGKLKAMENGGAMFDLRFSRLFLFCLMLFFLSPPVWAEKGPDRFFLMGDGSIHIKNVRSGQDASITLLTPDGDLNEEGFNKVDELFGFPTWEKEEHISPRLIFMLDYFSDLVAPGKVIQLESGYRSPEYNSSLRNSGGNVAKTSQHIDGMALDFSIEGVNGKELWEIIRSRNCCGVGHYGGSSIHLDSARPRFWEAATSKVKTGESDYNRRIYVSSDYDRYRPGDAVRLSFSSVSVFGFGIGRTVSFVNDSEGSHTVAAAQIRNQEDDDCILIKDRKASRFIHLSVPPALREGKYRMKVDFCRRPFEQMPEWTLSNEIEISKSGP